jgi:glutamine synthetase
MVLSLWSQPARHARAALLVNNGYKGYLEDRRPNSQGDPYQIASQVLKTISTVPTGAKAAA